MATVYNDLVVSLQSHSPRLNAAVFPSGIETINANQALSDASDAQDDATDALTATGTNATNLADPDYLSVVLSDSATQIEAKNTVSFYAGELNGDGTLKNGIGFGDAGLFGMNNDVPTFSIASLDGDAAFKGDITGATGTFTGSITGASGSFGGDLDAAGGSFAGSLTAASGTFSGTITSTHQIVCQSTVDAESSAAAIYGHGSGALLMGASGESTTSHGVFGSSTASDKCGVIGNSTHADGYAGYFLNDAGGVSLESTGETRLNGIVYTGTIYRLDSSNNLGSSSRRWTTAYANYFNANGACTFSGGMTVTNAAYFDNIYPNGSHNVGGSTTRWSTVYASAINASGTSTMAAILPAGTNNLGSTGSRWNVAYLTSLNTSGTSTLGLVNCGSIASSGNITPTGTTNLGSTGDRWNVAYCASLNVSGTSTLGLINCSSNLNVNNAYPNSGGNLGSTGDRWGLLYASRLNVSYNSAARINVYNAGTTTHIAGSPFSYSFT